MKNVIPAVVLCLVMAPWLSSHGGEPAVPDYIPSNQPDRERPFWVSAEMAVPNGQIRQEFFSESGLEDLEDGLEIYDEVSLEKMASKPSYLDGYECNAYTIMAGSVAPAPFDAAFEEARVVLYGTVSGKAAGFLRGQPATLYEMSAEEWVKAPEGLEKPEKIYFRYGDVKILVGNNILCHRNRRSPDRPEVGRKVLLMTSSVIHEDPLVLFPNEAHVFFEMEGGRASLPGVTDLLNPPGWGFVMSLLGDARKKVEGN